MAYNKKEIAALKQKVLTGTKVATNTLDGTVTTEIIKFPEPVSKFSVQSTGNLAGDVTVSVNGEDFVTGVSFTAGALASYNTHNVSAIKVTRTSGSGTLAIAAK